jgi:hypothetical protein
MENDYDRMRTPELQARILEIIPTLSEEQMRTLLRGLDKWQQPEPDEAEQPEFYEKRRYSRKETSIYTICETDADNFREYTKNTSPGGVFIETASSMSVDEKVFMTLFHSSFDTPIRAKGKIVWVNPKGMGVEFNNPISRISSA